jgi:hypothetical protein
VRVRVAAPMLTAAIATPMTHAAIVSIMPVSYALAETCENG